MTKEMRKLAGLNWVGVAKARELFVQSGGKDPFFVLPIACAFADATVDKWVTMARDARTARLLKHQALTYSTPLTLRGRVTVFRDETKSTPNWTATEALERVAKFAPNSSLELETIRVIWPAHNVAHHFVVIE